MIPTPEQLRELLDYFGRDDSPEWTKSLTSEQETLVSKNILRLAVLGAAIHPEAARLFLEVEKSYQKDVRYRQTSVDALLGVIRDNSLALEEDT